MAWGDYLNAHARVEPRRQRNQVKRLQQRIEVARRNGVAPHLIELWRAQLDGIGRFTREIVLPPGIALPKADKAIARQFGISPRTVRRIRQDRRLQAFMPQEAWTVPHWQRQAMALYAARIAAKRLMTPARFAKNERVALLGNGLSVEQEPASEAVYVAARKVREVLRRCERLLPSEYRQRPTWLAYLPQWSRIETRCGECYLIDGQQVFEWESHPRGRRIRRTTYDEGMPTTERD